MSSEQENKVPENSGKENWEKEYERRIASSESRLRSQGDTFAAIDETAKNGFRLYSQYRAQWNVQWVSVTRRCIWLAVANSLIWADITVAMDLNILDGQMQIGGLDGTEVTAVRAGAVVILLISLLLAVWNAWAHQNPIELMTAIVRFRRKYEWQAKWSRRWELIDSAKLVLQMASAGGVMVWSIYNIVTWVLT